ncbi:MAG: hypothetical protein IKH16_04915 [Selenomonadaceae bacterium]|nr:hypothetical protein [Selenomonadaceae bacterium]
MRKLASILFVLSLLTASFTQVLYPRKASAEDVWAITENSGGYKYEYYAQTHLIKDIEIGFMVPVKQVVNGRLGHNRMYIFRYMDDGAYGTWYFIMKP